MDSQESADKAASVQPKPLNKIQRRILGVLIEKARTTPDAYPLSLAGLVAGANQKSNRSPLMNLSPEQIDYAASDVLYLHRLKTEMERLLAREGRSVLADACFRFLPDRAALDVAGWADEDIFAH